MKNSLLACVAFVLVWAATGSAQKITEVKHNGPTIAAPRESLVTFRELFSYLQNDASIVKDEQAHQRWLTQQLQKI